ncbi:hypothetical protein ES703_41438 [subsurface metagenome]
MCGACDDRYAFLFGMKERVKEVWESDRVFQ